MIDWCLGIKIQHCIRCNGITAEPNQLALYMVTLNIHENLILNHVGCMSLESHDDVHSDFFFFLVYEKP